MALAQRYDYYEILELDPNAAAHEISEAYSRAKQTYSGNDPAIYTIFSVSEARELLKYIEEAYLVLGSRGLRHLYDKKRLQNIVSEMDLSHKSLLAEYNLSMEKHPTVAKIEAKFEKDPVIENEIQNMKEWDGEKLKKVREYRKLSFQELHQMTKVSAFYIQALEEMKADQLPAQVFVRGYVNQVSKALGLNDRLVTDTYMRKFRLTNELK
jgi:curved DNA-binding protein CbpA